MTFNFDQGDSLDDFLGGRATVTAKVLPTSEEFARIRQLDGVPAAPTFKVTCQKCGGRGRFISYAGRDCGPCFACKGKGSFERKTNPVQLAANRERAAERRVQSAQGNWDAFVAQYPAYAAVLTKGQTSRNDSWANICCDIIGKVRKYGDLYEGTLAMLQRSVDRDAQWAAQRQQEAVQQAQAAPVVDVSAIVELFQRAREAGLKRFTLRFEGAHFQADKTKDNVIWISESGYGSAKLGRIVDGAFKVGRDSTPVTSARIVEIAKDPLAAGIAYAQLTSSCSVCGRHLENQDSVDAGIGPICAGRLNRPGLKFVEVSL